MKFDFNEPNERSDDSYRYYRGKLLEKMPLLIAEGRIPVSVADVLERRLHSENPLWKKKKIDTGDMFVYHPDGKIKVVLDAQLLRELTPQTRFCNGAILLEDGAYEALDGAEFKLQEISTRLSVESAKTDPFWKYIARNGALVEACFEKFFPRSSGFSDHREGMGANLFFQGNKPYAKTISIGDVRFASSRLEQGHGGDPYLLVGKKK